MAAKMDVIVGRNTIRRVRWFDRQRILYIVGTVIALVLFAALILITQVILPHALIQSSRTVQNIIYAGVTPAKFGLRTKDMRVEVEPKLTLRGWFVYAEAGLSSRQHGLPPRGTVIILHGSGSCKESQLGLARLFSKAGFNSLLFDMRAHGESDGNYRTFGYYEHRDCSRVLDEANRRFGFIGPFAVYGESMGGAIALQFMADDPRVRCGVVVSSFATLREISHDYLQQMIHVSLPILADLAIPRAEHLAGFSVDAVRPEEAARRINRPVLLIHGAEDANISIRYGERIFRNLSADGCEWYPVPGGNHGNLWKAGGEAYGQRLLDFMRAHIE